MKIDLTLYDKILENRIRLQIMSVLMVNEDYDFNALKDLLEITDGNLASNLKTLEKEEYIEVVKTFINRKPNTRYKKTQKGHTAFQNHLLALEKIVSQQV